MGMASTLTGGYGNSYAQTAGQQTYNAYLQQLAGVMPELYGAAYDRYRAEGEDLYNEIVLTEQRRENAYNKLVSLMSLGYDPTDEELTAAGLTRPQANTLRSHYTPTYSGGDTRQSYNNGNLTQEEVAQIQAYLNKNYNAGLAVDGKYGVNTAYAVSKYVGNYSAEEVHNQIVNGLPSTFDYSNAVKWLHHNGFYIDSLMSKAEWVFAKNNYVATGEGPAAVSNYATYEDYVKSYLEGAAAKMRGEG